jgi:hypothetical protein
VIRDLGVPARLGAFVAGLALLGGLAALVGAATGNAPSAKPAHADETGMPGMGHGNTGQGHTAQGHSTPADATRASGLASGAGGYTFVPERATLPAGKPSVFRFRIVDARGRAQQRFDLDGGVRLHLIVVRRDFAGYQHVHPKPQADGSWSVPLTLAAAGSYRAFADFDAAGVKTVLGRDLFVAGRFAPVRLPPVSTTAAVDGYSVRLSHETLRAGKEAQLRFVVTRGGKPVPSFQSYVGHRGHLVALRDGDLAYSHVHPLPQGGPGEIVFHTELPAARSYRLFLQFKRGGTVHTAPFTVEVKP